MLLSECQPGDIRYVEEIRLREAVKRRFEILGMTKEARVEVLNRKKHGAMIIKVRGTRFAIGDPFAVGIVVKERRQDEK